MKRKRGPMSVSLIFVREKELWQSNRFLSDEIVNLSKRADDYFCFNAPCDAAEPDAGDETRVSSPTFSGLACEAAAVVPSGWLELPAFGLSPMLGRSVICGPAYSGKIWQNFFWVRLKACDCAASFLRSASDATTEPVVISSEHMKESRPMRMVEVFQPGCQV